MGEMDYPVTSCPVINDTNATRTDQTCFGKAPVIMD